MGLKEFFKPRQDKFLQSLIRAGRDHAGRAWMRWKRT